MSFNKFLDYCSWLLLSAVILLLTFAPRFIENIISGKNFFWNSILIGLALSGTWMFILFNIKRDYFDGDEKRGSAVLIQFFGIIMLTVFLTSYYSYETGKSNIYYKKAVLINKSTNIKTHTNYIFLLLNGREERFNPSYKEFKNLNEGDTLILKIGKGKIDYDIIYEFNKK